MVPNTDAAYQHALDAGATGTRPPADQFYGHRTATVRDPFGHEWSFQQEIEKLSEDELQKRWEQMSGDCPPPSEA
ncbi:MAG: hypothetical protein U1F71_03970 [Verrucomicrobiaceae bacterium]